MLIFGSVVHSTSECVHSTICVQGLRREVSFGVVVQYDWLGLCVIGQKVMVEFRAFKLALKWPCSAGIRLWNISVVTGGSRDTQSLGRDVSAINWRLLRKVVALDWFIPGRRAQSRQIGFAFRGTVGIWERVHCE